MPFSGCQGRAVSDLEGHDPAELGAHFTISRSFDGIAAPRTLAPPRSRRKEPPFPLKRPRSRRPASFPGARHASIPPDPRPRNAEATSIPRDRGPFSASNASIPPAATVPARSGDLDPAGSSGLERSRCLDPVFVPSPSGGARLTPNFVIDTTFLASIGSLARAGTTPPSSSAERRSPE